jgi:hypothetical protein
MKFLFERITKEAAIAMAHDHIESALAITAPLDHLLESRPLVVSCRGAGLDELGSNVPTLRLAPRRQLPTLIGDREIMLCLPAG